MSSNEKSIPKSLSNTESNIPIPKRFHVDSGKKPRKRNELPEVERYVESIVKARRDYDRENRENLTVADKSNRNTRRVSEKGGVYEKTENQAKLDRKKQTDSKPTGQIKTKARAKSSEYTADKDVDQYDERFRRFERMNYSQELNTNPILEIEKFLRKLYPNPYNLDKVSEFQVLRASENVPRINKKSPSFKPPSFFDVIAPSVDFNHSNDNLLSQSCAENGFIETDIFFDQDIIVQNGIIVNYDSDNYLTSNPSQSLIQGRVIELEDENDSIADGNVMSKLLKNEADNKSSNPYEGVGSRPSSNESEIKRCYHDRAMISKKTNTARTTNKECSPKVMSPKNKLNALVALGKQNAQEYDIGKLSNSYDSTEENSRCEYNKMEEEEDIKKAENFKNTSKISLKYYKKPTELYQLYHVMDKTAESILHITSRNEKCKEEKTRNVSSPDLKAGNNMKASELPQRDRIISSKDLEILNNSERLLRTKRRIKKENSTYRQIEKDLKKKSFIIAALENEKSKCERNVSSAQEKEENEKKPETEKGETDLDDSLSGIGSFSQGAQKLDEVLQYMCDCLRKFTNEQRARAGRTFSNSDTAMRENVEKLLERRTEDWNQNQKDNRTKHEVVKSTNSPNSDTTIAQTREHNKEENRCSGSYSPLEVIRNKPSASCWSLETEEKKKLSAGRRRRKKRPQTPQTISKSSSDEKILEMSPIWLEVSGGQISNSSPLSPETQEICQNDETSSQAAEPQNELGGCNEEQPPDIEVVGENQPKHPLPVRHRKQKKDSYRILKDALETEEKLLASNPFLDEKPKNDVNSFQSSKSAFVKRGAAKAESSFALEDLKQQRSGFVICVSSIPRHLRTGNPTKIPYATSLSISLSNLRKSCDLKTLNEDSKKNRLKKFTLEPGVERLGHQYTHRFEEAMLVKLEKAITAHTAITVGLVTVSATSTWKENAISKNSECRLKVKSVLPKKSLFVENFNIPMTSTSEMPTTANRSPSQVLSSTTLSLQRGKIQEVEKEDGGPEMTSEENILTLGQSNAFEQNSHTTCELLISEGTSQTFVIQNESSESQVETESESDRKKIENMLLRTYYLQHKLHNYWHRISCSQTPYSCPLKKKSTLLDLDVTCKSDESDLFPQISVNYIPTSSPTSIDNKDSQSLVYWLLEPNPTKQTQTKEQESDKTVQVERVDHATSYHPPSRGSEQPSTKENKDLRVSSAEAKDTNEEEGENFEKDDEDDDGCSSTYSFKSSNDFSESNEISNLEENSKLQKTTNKPDVKNSRFLQKIFGELESFRKPKNKANKEQETQDQPETKDDNGVSNKPKENHMVEVTRGVTIPSKSLKTVFKGKESTTELTIGLKDVRITDGSNISVEKKKFSQNHTKISISISKEKPEHFKDVCHTPRTFNATSTNVHRTFSSYYFGSLRPSLSECETKYSRLENETSKSLNNCNSKESKEDEEGEEDGDEDFKSVVSNVSSKSDIETPEANEPDKSICNKSQTLPPKSFAKHRFNFYGTMSMDSDYDTDEMKKSVSNEVSNYKKLEPLKEALKDMQTKMRKLKRNSYFSSSEYYQRALKLARMSAGFCQSCGNRSFVPEGGLDCYGTFLPRRCSNPCRKHYLSGGIKSSPNTSFYSFRSSADDVSTSFCNLDIHQNSYVFRGPTYPTKPLMRCPLTDIPIFMGKM